MKLSKILTLLLCVILTFTALCVGTFAYESYDTYTYDIDGEVLQSPVAYSASNSYDAIAMGLGTGKFGSKTLKGASDIMTDDEGNIYIADAGENDSDPGRILLLDYSYHVTAAISEYVDEYNRPQKLKKPKGLFITNAATSSNGEKELFICDSGNSKVVVFRYDEATASFVYHHTLEKPETALLTETEFVPESIAVDKYGKIFIISPACGEGIIAVSYEGEFTGFIGSQKVGGTAWERIVRRFQTKEQILATAKKVTVAYTNITVDSDGFIYVVTGNLDESKQRTNIETKEADNSPVKKLNTAGSEIMKRNGFFDPGGEVVLSSMQKVSSIKDIAIGREGTWSILDWQHSRIFTYDSNGNLLFAFGDSGDQLGNGEGVVALTYQRTVDSETGEETYVMLLLDKATNGNKIIPYTPSAYCDKIMDALSQQNQHIYSGAQDYWQQVLTLNNNFDLAYIGIGKALYSQGKYEEAMKYLAKAYETEYYALAFSKQQSSVLGKWLLVVVVLIVAIVVLIAKFMGWAKKKNKATSLKRGQKTYGEELLYVFHTMFHPFDGFWDLKHEKRGSVRAALTLLGVTGIALFYNSIGKAYLFNPRGTFSNILTVVGGLVAIVMLWVTANWCLTCLFEGEGSYKDIFVTTCYAIAPMAFILIVSTILTNFMTDTSVVNLVMGIGYVWCGFLLFFGMLTIHDYPLGKNLLITVCTIVAMIVILFVLFLFVTLLGKMGTFVYSLVSEIGDRL